MRRTLIAALIICSAIGIDACTVGIGLASPNEKVIHLTARKFEFSPVEITVKRGEPVVLEITSEDVRHGFTLPDFGVRSDIKLGAVNRISFTPDKAGRFTFACDVFCGAGHEEMAGTLVVVQ
jgi:cytochrome c oxidase subunit 2